MKLIYYLDDEIHTNEEVWLLFSVFLQSHIKKEKVVESLSKLLRTSRTTLRQALIATQIYTNIIKLYKKKINEPRPFMVNPKIDLLETQLENSYVLYIVSLIICIKSVEDSSYTNICWARAAGLPYQLINFVELEVLQALEWKIDPKEEEFEKIVEEFIETCTKELNTFPIFVLPGKRKWFDCIFDIVTCFGTDSKQ